MVRLIGHFGVEVLQVHGSVDDGVEADRLVGGEVGGPVIWSVDVPKVCRLGNVFGEISGAAAAALVALFDIAEGVLLLLPGGFHSG